MDQSTISSILQELNLREDSVANIYNYGSWVYGTNSATSDRDLMIITRSPKDPLVFTDELDYFHDFELYKLWNQYDVCVHSVENFEKLLEQNYLLAVECIFLPDEFKIKEQIDFQLVYREKYHNGLRLKQVAFHENRTAMKMFDPNDQSDYSRPRSRSKSNSQTQSDYLFKNLFHGFRYLDIVEQLIQTKSVHDFKRVSHVLDEMKKIRGDTTDDSNMPSVLSFIRDKSDEYKAKLDALVPTNTVKGTFEAHITFDCTYETEKCIERLKKTCENTKYKIIFIDLNTHRKDNKLQQLMTSSYHCGEYPSIVKQIEEQAYEQFQDFNITRIKIEALASNTGIPETNIEKKLFWNDATNYFEFHYKVLIKNDAKKDKLNELQRICRSGYTYPLHLSHNAFQQLDEEDFHYIITMRIFDAGRELAFQSNEEVVEYLTEKNYVPLKVVREFVVYDSYIELDQDWN